MPAADEERDADEREREEERDADPLRPPRRRGRDVAEPVADEEVPQPRQHRLQQEERIFLHRDVADDGEHAVGAVRPDVAVDEVVVPRDRVDERHARDQPDVRERVGAEVTRPAQSGHEDGEDRDEGQDEDEVEREVGHRRAQDGGAYEAHGGGRFR